MASIASVMKKILKQPASQNEIAELTNAGFDFKKATRQTVILVALYKKAAAGDLSAIKELTRIAGDGTLLNDSQRVIIIDDIQNKPV